MNQIRSIVAGLGIAAVLAVSPALAQLNAPLGQQPQQPDPQPQPNQQAVQALTTAQLAQIMTGAGLQSQAGTLGENGPPVTIVRGQSQSGASVQVAALPVCQNRQQACGVFKLLSVMSRNPLTIDAERQFHSRSFSAYLTTTDDGSAIILSDGMILSGGVSTQNILAKFRVFFREWELARTTLGLQMQSFTGEEAIDFSQMSFEDQTDLIEAHIGQPELTFQ